MHKLELLMTITRENDGRCYSFVFFLFVVLGVICNRSKLRTTDGIMLIINQNDHIFPKLIHFFGHFRHDDQTCHSLKSPWLFARWPVDESTPTRHFIVSGGIYMHFCIF